MTCRKKRQWKPRRDRMAPFTPVIGALAPYMIPQQADPQAAAQLLDEGKKVAILVGAGVKHASDAGVGAFRSRCCQSPAG